jgi:hypothetical protein
VNAASRYTTQRHLAPHGVTSICGLKPLVYAVLSYTTQGHLAPHGVIGFIILPCFLLALIFNEGYEPFEILWAFSIYLEAVAILPQVLYLFLFSFLVFFVWFFFYPEPRSPFRLPRRRAMLPLLCVCVCVCVGMFWLRLPDALCEPAYCHMCVLMCLSAHCYICVDMSAYCCICFLTLDTCRRTIMCGLDLPLCVCACLCMRWPSERLMLQQNIALCVCALNRSCCSAPRRARMQQN